MGDRNSSLIIAGGRIKPFLFLNISLQAKLDEEMQGIAGSHKIFLSGKEPDASV